MKKIFLSLLLISSFALSCQSQPDNQEDFIDDERKEETSDVTDLNEDTSKNDNSKDSKPDTPSNPDNPSIPDEPTNPQEPNPPTDDNPDVDPISDPSNPGDDIGDDPNIEPPNPGDDTGDDPSIDPPNPSDDTGDDPSIEPPNPGDDTGDDPSIDPPNPDDPSVEPSIDPIPPSDDNVEITGIELLVHELSMYLGHTYKLNYQTLPVNTSKVSTYFKSDIPSIVSTSNDGTLTANKVGKTLITVITGEGYVDRCIVNVIENPSFKFSAPCLDLYINSTKSFSISGSGITYESSDTSIATISQNGQIQTYDNPGRVIITARKENNVSTCDLRVFPHNQDIFKFTDIDSTTCSIDGFLSNNVAVADLVVPFENSSGKKVVKISYDAFNCSLLDYNKKRKSILLPNSIKEISSNALAYGEADTFYTPYYLETIGSFAFMNFYFKEIELNINLKEIGMRAFINCHLFEEIVIPYQTVLRLNCFHDCNPLANNGGLKRVYIQEGVTFNETETDYFNGCKTLQYFNIPTSFKTIPDKTFCFVYKPAFENGIFIPKTVNKLEYLNFYKDNDDKTLPFDLFVEHEVLPSTYSLDNRIYYLYSKNSPTTSGNYWHYVNGEITKW